MKTVKHTISAIVAVTIVVLTLVSITHLTAKVIPTHAENNMSKCVEYESEGYIPKGSCECAKQLYPDFAEAYDLMDACYIIEKMENIKLNRLSIGGDYK